MADREKVLKGLECCKRMEMDYEIEYCPDECPYSNNRDCIQTLCSDALELLKEQEPKRYPTEISRDIVDEFYGYMAVCPLCNCMWIMYRDEDMKFCPGCGMAVKWNDKK